MPKRFVVLTAATLALAGLNFGCDRGSSTGTGSGSSSTGTGTGGTGAGSSTTGTGVDRGAPLASTAFGLTAYIHNFSFTGTSVVVKIQDSADNATFADLTGAVFTTITTGATAERITIGTTATVRRYLRVVTTGTFTNFQFAVNVAPYDTAQQ